MRLNHIRTPKLSAHRSKDKLFPYYAGFSEEFAFDVIQREATGSYRVLDPWNGSGTTTYACDKLGIHASGVDLNPVMVVVSKARNSSLADLKKSKQKLKKLNSSCIDMHDETNTDDPLTTWIDTVNAKKLSSLISEVLGTPRSSTINQEDKIFKVVNSIENWQALILLSIFLILKKITKSSKTSNPTWTKVAPYQIETNTAVDWRGLVDLELERLSVLLEAKTHASTLRPNIMIGNSEKLHFEAETFDLILGSPPYCTRIDYAKATLVELSVIGLTPGYVDESLRKKLMGTTSIRQESGIELINTCNELLDRIRSHPSSGSKSYYYKNFKQYFASLQNSISEIHRVLKLHGSACIVLQGSHYKEIPIDLPNIFAEIADSIGLSLIDKIEFSSARSFGSINTKSLKYRPHILPTEQALLFEKFS